MMRINVLIKTLSVLGGLAVMATGQTFNSGSNGSDGALTLTTPGTITFDPKSFTPPLDPDGDGIYHFTTITIGAGVTVVFSGRNLNGPVYWLASGAVQIDGTLSLNGEQGHLGNTIAQSNRYPAYPGPGGFFGGMGGRFGATTNTQVPPQPGGGPGGGVTGTQSGNGTGGDNGTYTGNQFAVPLIGGSGGGGGFLRSDSQVGGGGGAGGGAILIASSTSIRVNGTIEVRGGSNGVCSGCPAPGGGGASGAIRLVANTVSGSGFLDTRTLWNGSLGVIRVEAFQYTGPGNYTGPLSVASPSNLFLPSGANPTVRISSIAGISTPSTPTGSFTVPDIAINTTAAVPVVIEARNIPLGTVVKLRIFSENGLDQLLDTTPLGGTVSLSTATASAIFPSGFSRGFVRATWTQ